MTDQRIKPIFIFSLPRSGSTLLQRILTVHDDIASASEPWVLLPLISMAESEHIHAYSNFSSQTSQMAVHDFYSNTPDGWNVYYDSIRAFLDVSYQAYCNKNELYFLDKTPRYYLIIDEIYKVFPDAKCIFLFRNPLESMASMMNTWRGGRLKLHHQYVDLYHGVECLHHGYLKHQDKAFKVNYTELVSTPDLVMEEVCSFLGLEYNNDMVEAFSQVDFSGRMGDPVGVKKYSQVSINTNKGWRKVLSTPVRRWYCKKYIHSLGDDILHSFGFTQQELLDDLLKEPVRYDSVVGDLFWVVASPVYRMIVSKVLQNSPKQRVLGNEFFD